MDERILLERIADGRTDLVVDWVREGHPADATSAGRLLEWCAYYGDVSSLRFLLEHGGALAALGEDLGLNGAAFHGHWRLCEFLLESGAAVNGADGETGETALHSALCTPDRDGHDLVVRVLLDHGADVNRATKPGAPTGAFMRDCRTKGEAPLHRAAAFGTEETIAMLLAAGARIDARDANGETPLSWASWYGRPDGVLRQLCYGDHAIRTGRKPMRVSLLGRPCGRRDG
jgi:ankyrin repeat protein